MRETLRAGVLGVGGYLPDLEVTNEDLSATVDTSDDWIRQRTGILSRRRAAVGEADVGSGDQRGAARARRRREIRRRR